MCSRHERSAAAADSLAAFLQLGMQPVQTVQAAEPVASGDMRPALALRRNATAVGTPAQWPYQYDTHHCSTQALTATAIRGIGRSLCDCLDSLRRTTPGRARNTFPQAYPSVAALIDAWG
jgi:hypothetical protein